MIVAATLLACAAAFTLSASAGLGGSLILVPALGLLLGTKQGVALAALLLALNNVSKVSVYRRTVPYKAAAGVLVLTLVGAAIGARLLVSAPPAWVGAAVIVSIAAGLLVERAKRARARQGASSAMAFFAGATSGFSGTSGPLKGVAIRNLGLDRLHFVGAASLVSLGGDATKSAVYAEARLLDAGSWVVAAIAVPVMVGASLLGRRLNERIGERAFYALFWTVMAGYTIRVVTRL